MARAEIIQGPHVLYKGTDGSVTAGIKVRRIGPKAEIEDAGYLREWCINSYTLKAQRDELITYLGIDVMQYDLLMGVVEHLEKSWPASA